MFGEVCHAALHLKNKVFCGGLHSKGVSGISVQVCICVWPSLFIQVPLCVRF